MGSKKDGQAPVNDTQSPARALTLKQKAFIKEYLKHFNASKAARDAGLTEKNPGQAGYEQLKKPEVQAELQRRIKKTERDAEISKNWILKQLKTIVTYDPAKHLRLTQDGTIGLRDGGGDFPKGLAKHLDLSTGEAFSDTGEGSSQSKSFSYKGKDRIRALELIAKLMGYMDARTGVFDEAGELAHQQRISDAIRRRTG